MTEATLNVGECVRCKREFEAAHYAHKYCSDECRELAGVERKLGVESGLYGTADGEIAERECDGYCCDMARKKVEKVAKGWVILTNTVYPARAGYNINYCPFCGGRLVY